MTRVITRKFLAECFTQSESGELFWKVRPEAHFTDKTQCSSWNGRYAGTSVGTTSPKGYRRVHLAGKFYQAHRLVYAMVKGGWPRVVDHINGNRLDNRIENLRAASPSDNAKNRKLQRNNRSGLHGVYWRECQQRWTAQINVDSRKKHLGLFKTRGEAQVARKAAERLHGFHPNHGRAA